MDEYNEDYEYNEDWEKENDYYDGMRQGADCTGSYCMNCDFLSTCDHVPEGAYD